MTLSHCRLLLGKNVSIHAITFQLKQVFFVERFPFNWHSPVGYTIAFSIQMLQGFYAICIVTNQTSFIVGSCWMLVALAGDITNDLLTINKIQGNSQELTEKFKEFIHLHSKAKELCAN